jgi:hypothetical protein
VDMDELRKAKDVKPSRKLFLVGIERLNGMTIEPKDWTSLQHVYTCETHVYGGKSLPKGNLFP